MSRSDRRPPGYVTKTEAADRLGVSERTVDRRQRKEEWLTRVLRVGRRVWLRAADVEAYFRLSVERGHL